MGNNMRKFIWREHKIKWKVQLTERSNEMFFVTILMGIAKITTFFHWTKVYFNETLRGTFLIFGKIDNNHMTLS